MRARCRPVVDNDQEPVAGKLLVELARGGPAVAASAHAPDDNRELEVRRDAVGHVDGLSCEAGVRRVSLARLVRIGVLPMVNFDTGDLQQDTARYHRPG